MNLPFQLPIILFGNFARLVKDYLHKNAYYLHAGKNICYNIRNMY